MKQEPVYITLSWKEVRIAYEHFLKEEMPKNMTFHVAAQITMKKAGDEDFLSFLESLR